MGWLSARFFARLQAASFYREAHAEALAGLPSGEGRQWIDVGCGPGLVARLAAAKAYHVSAYDLDPAMLSIARRHPDAAAVAGGFHRADLASLAASASRADVVSAASLLAVLPDRRQALRELLACVKPGGCLLLIETTARLQPQAAWRWLRREAWGKGGLGLWLWALVRRGRIIVDDALLRDLGRPYRYSEALEGLLGVWRIEAAETEMAANPSAASRAVAAG